MPHIENPASPRPRSSYAYYFFEYKKGAFIEGGRIVFRVDPGHREREHSAFCDSHFVV
jgi:hypothetical protein